MKVYRMIATILAMAVVLSVGGVFATWKFTDKASSPTQQDISLTLGDFIYTPQEMPDGELSVIQRLSDILNQKYTTDTIKDSRDFLLNETIQVYWGGNIYADPYVGSMDVNFQDEIAALFGDVLSNSDVSFILKNQDLNGDGYKEIAIYSTSDPLECAQEFEGIVCVYVTVFTPQVDKYYNVIGYHLVCESLRGYCYEVYYGQGDTTPSFSTDEWRDDIGYYHYIEQQYYTIPDSAMSQDGVTPYKLDFNSYNTTYQYDTWMWSSTLPYGRRLWECLLDKIPYIW